MRSVADLSGPARPTTGASARWTAASVSQPQFCAARTQQPVSACHGDDVDTRCRGEDFCWIEHDLLLTWRASCSDCAGCATFRKRGTPREVQVSHVFIIIHDRLQLLHVQFGISVGHPIQSLCTSLPPLLYTGLPKRWVSTAGLTH